MTNRKSHTPFRLVPKSTTLDDLERPNCSYVNRANFSQASRGFVSDSWAFLLQGVSIAIYASPVPAIVGMSVRLSVRLSVTHWHWVKTTQARITKSSPADSPRTLVFGIKKIHPEIPKGSPRARALNESGVKKSQFSTNKSPYLRNGAR